MRKTLSLLMLLVLLSGCASRFYVRTNGYLEPNESIAPNTSFFVENNPQAVNDIFDRELKTKIERLLVSRGYRLAGPNDADYHLQYLYDAQTDNAWEDRRSVGVGAGYYGAFGRRNGTLYGGPTFISYAPERVTVSSCALQLKVLKGTRSVWVGESANPTSCDDLRQGIDYLLAGAFEQFGRNTGKNVSSDYDESNPAVQALRQTP